MRRPKPKAFWQRWAVRLMVGFIVLVFVAYRTLQMLGLLAHVGRH